MDKSLGTLYQKLSNLFHSNTSNHSPVEISSSLPTTNYLERMPLPVQQHRSSSRISRQISIKTTDHHLHPPLEKLK